MAIIIDTNCFANVFSRNSIKHDEFAPVLDWIINGKGIIVYGGTTYLKELRASHKYLKILRHFRTMGKVYCGNQEQIDKIQKDIENINKDPDFDDPHLPAIIINTKCRLICSEDVRSVRHVQNSKYYPSHTQVPRYYTGKRNVNLLCDKYIHDNFKPLIKMNNDNKKLSNKVLDKL